MFYLVGCEDRQESNRNCPMTYRWHIGKILYIVPRKNQSIECPGLSVTDTVSPVRLRWCFGFLLSLWLVLTNKHQGQSSSHWLRAILEHNTSTISIMDCPYMYSMYIYIYIYLFMCIYTIYMYTHVYIYIYYKYVYINIYIPKNSWAVSFFYRKATQSDRYFQHGTMAFLVALPLSCKPAKGPMLSFGTLGGYMYIYICIYLLICCMKIMKWRMLHATAENFEKDLAIQLKFPACPNVSQILTNTMVDSTRASQAGQDLSNSKTWNTVKLRDKKGMIQTTVYNLAETMGAKRKNHKLFIWNNNILYILKLSQFLLTHSLTGNPCDFPPRLG